MRNCQNLLAITSISEITETDAGPASRCLTSSQWFSTVGPLSRFGWFAGVKELEATALADHSLKVYHVEQDFNFQNNLDQFLISGKLRVYT